MRIPPHQRADTPLERLSRRRYGGEQTGETVFVLPSGGPGNFIAFKIRFANNGRE